MLIYRYPVLMWRDSSGTYTATLVGDFDGGTAYAATAEEAMEELMQLLRWRAQHEPWALDVDFDEPRFFEAKVEARAQYTHEKRVLPCREVLALRVPCVTGTQENGLQVCAVPHLGLRFDVPEPAELKSLVNHYVRERLQGMTPLQIAMELPPTKPELTELVFRHPGDKATQVPPWQRRELKLLFSVADPLLQDLGRKRSASAAYEREALSEQLASKLQRERANVLLVGESGVGKSTLLLDAVKRLVRRQPAKSGDEDDQADLRNYRFWRGNAGRLIAGMRYLGEWEERCEEFIEKLTSIEGVFCAENLLELVQVGGQGPGNSVAAFLLPYLQRGELRIIAEATPQEVSACARLLPGLLDVFHVIHVPQFNEQEALSVLTRIANAHASSARLDVQPGVIPLTHRLFTRFMPYHVFPGPAAQFVRNLCRGHERSITKSDVIAHFLKQTGLPEVLLQDELPLPFEEVRQTFVRQIIGQSNATEAAARLICRIKAGLTDPRRPYGVFFFSGPTGVGKTALAKAITEFCFGASGQRNRLIRLDMSEYGSGNAARRFVEQANGKPAKWIEQVRTQPFSVVLFDEIEKAAFDVFDLMLALLDEGRLTDRFGRVTNFKSSILILTSNIGSTSPTGLGFTASSFPAYESEVGKFFRPEFFNRLDAVITFEPLTQENVREIARKELRELEHREGLKSAGLKLEWSDRLLEIVTHEGYDHRFGARPLQRAIERLIMVPLARWRLSNPQIRDRTLRLDFTETNDLIVGS